MSSNENPILRDLHANATAVGEIESFTTDAITIRGPFAAGVGIALRPGVRVFILDEDTAIDIMPRHAEVDF